VSPADTKTRRSACSQSGADSCHSANDLEPHATITAIERHESTQGCIEKRPTPQRRDGDPEERTPCIGESGRPCEREEFSGQAHACEAEHGMQDHARKQKDEGRSRTRAKRGSKDPLRMSPQLHFPQHADPAPSRGAPSER
jgi:hypothetical protein